MHNRVAHDLISNASRANHPNDVAQLKDLASVPKAANPDPNANADDLRSVRSEYDYQQKKKFTDVLG